MSKPKKNRRQPFWSRVVSWYRRFLAFCKSHGGMLLPFVIVMIAFLVFADINAIDLMFKTSEINMKDDAIRVFSILFAILLEGLPVFFSSFLLQMLDKSRMSDKRAGSKKASIVIGTVISILGMLASFVLVIYIRWQNIAARLAANNSQPYGRYYLDLFLMFSPVLTSALAFVGSLLITKSDYVREIKSNVDRLGVEVNERKEIYQRCKEELETAKLTLWRSVAPSTEPMPTQTSNYLFKVYNHAANQVKRDVLCDYRAQLLRYNDHAIDFLKDAIAEMSKRTTTPLDIKAIDVYKVIADFDAKQPTAIERFSFEKTYQAKFDDFALRLMMATSEIPFDELVKNIFERKKKSDGSDDGPDGGSGSPVGGSNGGSGSPVGGSDGGSGSSPKDAFYPGRQTGPSDVPRYDQAVYNGPSDLDIMRETILHRKPLTVDEENEDRIQDLDNYDNLNKGFFEE